MCIRDRYETYVNAVLSEQALDGNSLMTAYLDLNEKPNLIRPDIIIVGMLTIGLVGALMGWVLSLFEKKVAPWRYK